MNGKGVLDLDVTKGCSRGTALDPNGCYGLCYACRISKANGYDFSHTIIRQFRDPGDFFSKMKEIAQSPARFVRIGTMGDPSEAWDQVAHIADYVSRAGKPIVIITKHWIEAPDDILRSLIRIGAYINTSISPLDTESQIAYRLGQFHRIQDKGGRSILRIVTIDPNLDHPEGRRLAIIQAKMMGIRPLIDNPLRAFRSSPIVKDGIIRLQKAKIHTERSVLVSLHSPEIYLGSCPDCPDQCGLNLIPKAEDLLIQGAGE